MLWYCNWRHKNLKVKTNKAIIKVGIRFIKIIDVGILKDEVETLTDSHYHTHHRQPSHISTSCHISTLHRPPSIENEFDINHQVNI